ncbi:MAG: hypothetical protein GX154_11450 [Clostridiales bacterium]|nr:hypothetical protein [Clostridiales bacterium]
MDDRVSEDFILILLLAAIFLLPVENKSIKKERSGMNKNYIYRSNKHKDRKSRRSCYCID